MPELPEVQVVVNGIIEKFLNKEIAEIIEIRPKTVQYFTEVEEFGKILDIERRGKFILLFTDKKLKIVVHLRMTGKLISEETEDYLPPHARAYFVFKDKTRLIFDDARTFGKIQIYQQNAKIESIEKLGVEPLTDNFNEKYLKNILKNKKAPIKNLLLNQHLVAGLGNIYVAELLYRAKISPKKKGGKLTSKEIVKIVKETKSVLQEAIKHNGTTISDYRSIYNKTGEFQNFLKVYQKKICECGNEISRIKQAGRSTYYCSKCQK